MKVQRHIRAMVAAGVVAIAAVGLTACGGDEPSTASVAEPTATDRPLPDATTGEVDAKVGKDSNQTGDDPGADPSGDDPGDAEPAPDPPPAVEPQPKVNPTDTNPDANAKVLKVAVYQNPTPDQPRFSWGGPHQQQYQVDTITNPILRKKAGATTIEFINRTGNPHSFHISGPNSGPEIGGTPILRKGSAKVKVKLLRGGDYNFYCSVLGHRTKGMEGHLVVS